MANSTLDGVTYVDPAELPQDERLGAGDVRRRVAAPGFDVSVTTALCR